MARLLCFFFLCFSIYELISCGCPENSDCLPLSACKLLTFNRTVIYPCDTGRYCCPRITISLHAPYDVEAKPASTVGNTVVPKPGIFSEKCGIVSSTDKIVNGETAEMGQFPWMALLGFKQKNIPTIEFGCGGSIIANRWVLTAAHCFTDSAYKLEIVRVGEYNLSSEIDCVSYGPKKVCADPHKDIPVSSIKIHSKFNLENLKNDIALVKLRNNIVESDYVRPICLPFAKTPNNIPGQNLTISGWGKGNFDSLYGLPVLQFAKVVTWDQNTCNQLTSPKYKPIETTQICANGLKSEDACKGDSGGPLVNATVDLQMGLKFVQLGIVSHSSAFICGDPKVPTIYTRVERYMEWIVQYVD